MPSRLDRSRLGRSRLSGSRFGGGAFGSGPAPALPTITVSGGTITSFSRGGVDYVEILFQQSGSFSVSGDVPWHNRALAGGGANGGRATNTTYIPGGGGAGGLLRTLGSALTAGSYTVTIGAGAPANATTGGGMNGSSSSLVTPSGTDTAVGGGKGAMSGTGNTIGADGGSGGGGRGGSASQTSLSGGSGMSGQGYAGGSGLATDTEAQRGSGGGGGSGGAGGTAIAGVPGAAGPGLALDWIATPLTVCRGGPGILATVTGSSADETWGNGAQGSIAGTAGKGGDGFLFLVVRADQAQVVSSATQQTITVPSGAAISTFTRSGVNYTQALMDNLGGQITASGPVAGASLALVPPGGAGGRTAGSGTRAGGGAGGLPRIQRNVTLLAGTYTITQGTPGTGTTLANGWGGNGTDSTMTGPIALTAPGGGGGGGNATNQNVGRDGGNGGGGMGASSVGYAGGVSTSDGYPGGAGYANADNILKSGGGGGGAGGAGGAGISGAGGAGGPGVLVEFMNPPRTVCGGGGGNGQTNGVGQDGGTNSDSADQPGWGAGSGARTGNQPANGGLPFFVLVVPSANANIVAG